LDSKPSAHVGIALREKFHLVGLAANPPYFLKALAS